MNPIPFDLPMARRLAEFSRRAYTLDGTRLVAPDTGATVLIEDIGDAIVLAFRGTQTIRDWLTDLRVVKEEIGAGIAIHQGFLKATNSIFPRIVDFLLPPGADKSKLKPLLITGHSLGGAEASLAAFFLQREGMPVKAVYTFASPRVGNAKWREAYNNLCGFKTYRLVGTGDLVPLLPGLFTPPHDGFRHVGQEVLIEGYRLLIEPSHLWELALDGWRTYRAIKSGNIDFLLDFHSISSDYIDALSRASQITL